MSKNVQKRVMDIIGAALLPGVPAFCLGNGGQGFDCCDECDDFLLCFPEFDLKSKEDIAMGKDNRTNK